MLHPQEINLVQIGSTGVVIPSKAFNTLLAEAEKLDKAQGRKGDKTHVVALKAQATRQVAYLTVPQQVAA